jgi:hypothetical protein
MLEASYSASRSFGRHDGNPPGLIVPPGNLRNLGLLCLRDDLLGGASGAQIERTRWTSPLTCSSVNLCICPSAHLSICPPSLAQTASEKQRM